jgi:hypothetical protein
MWTWGSAVYAQYFCAVIVNIGYQVCCVLGIGAIMENLYIADVIIDFKAIWIGHILHRNYLPWQVIEGKIKGGIEVTGRWGRRCRKLLDNFNPFMTSGTYMSHLKIAFSSLLGYLFPTSPCCHQLWSISTSRYFKVHGNMEKKWENGIPTDLIRLFVSGTYISCWSWKG